MTQIILGFLASAVLSYLLGSVNFSIILTRIIKKRDIRKYGSGNAGATNVLRSVGKVPAALTMLGDILKMVVAIYLTSFLLGEDMYQSFPDLVQYYAGFFCMIGHIYPIYFKFKGGKGVATAAGLLLVLDWRIFLIELVIFIVTVAWSRMVSLGSVLMAVAFPILAYALYSPVKERVPTPFDGMIPYEHWLLTLIAALFAVLVLFKHKDNLVRIYKGTESRINLKKDKNSSPPRRK